LIIDFFSRLSESQRFKLQSKLDVSGRKEFLSMGSNLQLGPEDRRDETPDYKVITKSGDKYVAAFDPNKQANGELDQVSAIYEKIYKVLLDIFEQEPDNISNEKFSMVVENMYQAELLHYSSNNGELLETPLGRWENGQKSNKDKNYKNSEKPLRSLKNQELRANFDRQQNIKAGQDKFSVSYFDANAEVEERAYFGKLEDTNRGFEYFEVSYEENKEKKKVLRQ